MATNASRRSLTTRRISNDIHPAPVADSPLTASEGGWCESLCMQGDSIPPRARQLGPDARRRPGDRVERKMRG